jgi:hypothetical protein
VQASSIVLSEKCVSPSDIDRFYYCIGLQYPYFAYVVRIFYIITLLCIMAKWLMFLFGAAVGMAATYITIDPDNVLADWYDSISQVSRSTNTTVEEVEEELEDVLDILAGTGGALSGDTEELEDEINANTGTDDTDV